MDPNQPNQDDNHTGDGRQAVFSSPTVESTPAPQPAETAAPVQPAEPIAAPTEPAPTAGATPATEPVTDPPMPEPASGLAPVAAPTTNPDPVATPGIIASTPTIATTTETGDIILSPDGPKPHNKRPFIIGGAIIILILAITGVVLAVIGGFGSNKYTEAEVREKWEEYTAALGDNTMLELQNNQEEAVTYAQRTEEIYKTFIDFFRQSKLHSDSELNSLVNENFKILKVLNISLTPNNFNQSLIAEYTKNSATEAQAQINSIFDLDTSNDILTQFTNSLKEYYSIQIELFDVYQQNNCFQDGTIDEVCIANIENSTAIDLLIQRQENAYLTYQDYFPLAYLVFYNQTQTINKEIEQN